VVKARWLECHSTERRIGARTYKAVSTDRYLNTNTLTRISPVVLTAFSGGKLEHHRDEFDRISNSALRDTRFAHSVGLAPLRETWLQETAPAHTWGQLRDEETKPKRLDWPWSQVQRAQ
jgi:hypothetical protein